MKLNISLFCVICLFYVLDGVHAGYVHDKEIEGSLKMHRIIASFEDATIRCKQEDAVLISPWNNDIGNVLRSLISNNYKDMSGKQLFYMDAKSRYESGVYVNAKNITLDNMMIVKSDMTTLDPNDGDCIAWNINTVKAVPCHTRLSYICFKADKKSKTESVDKPEDFILDCGIDGYKLNNATGSCYKLHPINALWDQAYWTCFHEGGYLAILNDETEMNVVYHNILTHGIETVAIGLRAPEGNNTDWTSIDRVPVGQLFNYWSGGNGAPSNGRSRCAYLESQGLYDFNCAGTEAAFVCEKTPVKIPLAKLATSEI